MSRVMQWDAERSGEISEDAIRRNLTHPERFRIAKKRYPPGSEFPGIQREGRTYVVRGRCRYVFGDLEFSLASGQFADLPDGHYYFEVIGPNEVEIVSTWSLPPAFWKS